MNIWNRINKISALFLALILCISLCSCTDPLKPSEEDMEPVLIVDSMEVPYAFYRGLVLSCRERVAADADIWSDAQQAKDAEEKIRNEVMQAIRDFYAVFALCKEYDIDIEDDYIMEQVDQMLESQMDQYKDTDAYAAALEKDHLNHSVNRLMRQQEVCSSTLYYAMLNNGAIETNPDTLRDLVNSDAFIRVKQILIVGEQTSVSDDGSFFTPAQKHTNEEARRLAEQVRDKYLAGEDFDKLVHDYGESLYMTSNTDGYYLCRGMWDQVNEDAAFSLVIDQVSPVIESDQGYSIFLRCEKDEAYMEAKFTELCQNYYGASFRLALEEKSAALEVETTALYDSVSIEDMK